MKLERITDSQRVIVAFFLPILISAIVMSFLDSYTKNSPGTGYILGMCGVILGIICAALYNRKLERKKTGVVKTILVQNNVADADRQELRDADTGEIVVPGDIELMKIKRMRTETVHGTKEEFIVLELVDESY